MPASRASAWPVLSLLSALLFFGIAPLLLGAEGDSSGGGIRLRIATWNIENYLVMNRVVEGQWFPAYPKPEAEKASLRRVLHDLDADVLALQEMGEQPFLLELQRDLRRAGLDYPYAVLFEAADPVRHIALLSRVPPVEAGGRADLAFPYRDERIPMKRGLQEVHFEVAGHHWVLFNLHLKSRYTDFREDPRSLQRRTAEAGVARDWIRSRYPAEETRYIILGDFNDTTRSAPLRRFLSVNDQTLAHMLDAQDSSGRRWTHRWQREDVYSRVDFILVSPALLSHVVNEKAWIFEHQDVQNASDHRPVVTELFFPAAAEPNAKGATEPIANLGLELP